ncbi:hypothetical protein N7467_001670 [Penicillium canescens]|nr:hypothetical protein N7467_001670 [Penicillium canescens]
MPMVTAAETQAKHPATIATQKLKIIKMSRDSTGFGAGNLHESADYPSQLLLMRGYCRRPSHMPLKTSRL